MTDPTHEEAVKQAQEQLAEFALLLDLTTQRLWDVQRDFLQLQADMVKAHATLASLLVPAESQAGDSIWTDQPAGGDIWGPG